MEGVSVTYRAEKKVSENDDSVLEITKKCSSLQENETFLINVIHRHYDGGARTESEGITLPLETFKTLIDEMWKGN